MLRQIKRYIKLVWNYVRSSWEGPDGRFSYKRATQFIFVNLLVYMIKTSYVKDQWTFLSFLTIALLFTLVAILLKPQDIIEGLRAAAGLKNNYAEGPAEDWLADTKRETSNNIYDETETTTEAASDSNPMGTGNSGPSST